VVVGCCRSLSVRWFLSEGKYMADCDIPENANKYLLLWSNAEHWKASMIVPVVSDSWCTDALRYIGLDQQIEMFDAPLLDMSPDMTDEQELFYLHLRLVMSHVGQLLLYVVLPQSPPQCFINVLDPNTRTVSRNMWLCPTAMQ
jgi:hypothetical protein